MIESAFLQFKGVGEKTCTILKDCGIKNWYDFLNHKEKLPLSQNRIQSIEKEIHNYLRALEKDDIEFLVNQFKGPDQWRILARYFESLSYFDIETSGLNYDSYITLIVCYHKGRLYQFVKNENLEEFLDLLTEVELLVSFNGASFDVPWIRNYFHIPTLPCPHIDLRWICKRIGLEGGLKFIEKNLEIKRPYDLIGVDGFEAVLLWDKWDYWSDEDAKEKLIRYCSADVLSLKVVASKVLQKFGVQVDVDEDIFRLL